VDGTIQGILGMAVMLILNVVILSWKNGKWTAEIEKNIEEARTVARSVEKKIEERKQPCRYLEEFIQKQDEKSLKIFEALSRVEADIKWLKQMQEKKNEHNH